MAQFDLESIPRFAGDREEVLESVIRWVHANVRRELLDENWIVQRFLRRTIAEIIADGFTLAYMPCLERCLVTAALLGHNGMESYLVLHDQPGGVWHFAIEVPLESGSYAWADYSSRESRLFAGQYQYFEKPESIPRFMRIKGPKYDKSIWQSRPPLRMLAAMGVSLASRYATFCRLRQLYEDQFLAGDYLLSDHLVRDPVDSVYAREWETYEVLEVGQGKGTYVDFTSIHLYLERAG